MIANATMLPDIFTQSVLVPNQSSAERSLASEKALKSVIIRATGKVNALDNPVVIAATSSAESMIESFYYESTDEMVDYQGQPVVASRLILKFSRSLVETKLREAQLPVWPANRPSILVWFVTQDDAANGFRKHILLPSEENEAIASANKVVKELGVPIVLPLMDLKDQLALPAVSAWSLDDERILQASKRYPADGVLVIRFSQASSGLWLASWSLKHKAQQQLFDSQSTELDSLFYDGFQQVASYLSSLYGVVSSGLPSNSLIIDIEGVTGFAQYAAILSYLDGLTVVSHVAPININGSNMRLALSVEGNRDVLLDTLALDKKLERVKMLPPEITFNGVPTVDTSAFNQVGNVEQPIKFVWGVPN